jgi:adenine deaminase
MGGAKGLKLDRKTGSLTPGKEADIILLDAEAINVAPLNNAPGAVVTLMDRTNVDTVMVAGQIRKWQGQLLGHRRGETAPRAGAKPRLHLRGCKDRARPVCLRPIETFRSQGRRRDRHRHTAACGTG